MAIINTELGFLSEHWPLVSIGELFDIQQGKQVSARHRNGDHIRPFLRTANVFWGEIVLNPLDEMHFKSEEQSKLLLQDGDILVCEGGDIGRTAVWTGGLSECYYQNHLHRLRPKTNNILPGYFALWMWEAIRNRGLYITSGNRTTIPNLSKSRLAAFQLPLPPMQEQQAIEVNLNAIRKAKEARQQELTLERERKAALMDHLFTHGTRNELRKQTEIGEIPISWEIKNLGEISKIERGKFAHRPRNDPDFYGGVVPFIQTGDVSLSNGHIKNYSQTLNEKGLAVSRVFPAGTIVITIAANIGFTGILDFDSAFPDSLIGLTPNEELDREYLNYYLMTQQKEMDYKAPRGTQKNINIQFLSPWPVIVPHLSEQIEIARILLAVDKKIEALLSEIKLLEEFFTASLEDLMTGKLSTQPLLEAPKEMVTI